MTRSNREHPTFSLVVGGCGHCADVLRIRARVKRIRTAHANHCTFRPQCEKFLSEHTGSSGPRLREFEPPGCTSLIVFLPYAAAVFRQEEILGCYFCVFVFVFGCLLLREDRKWKADVMR